jgi:class 3 adenylate cyclase
VDKAIDYWGGAGGGGGGGGAYEDAAGHYQKALQALDAREVDDDLERCEILLGLGDVLWNAGDPNKAGESFIQAADIARKLGAGEQLALAAVGLGGPTLRGWGTDERLVALLEEGLEAVGDEDRAIRVRVLSRLAMELIVTLPERAETYSLEAVEAARRVGDAGALSRALVARLFTLSDLDTLHDQFAIATEIVRLAEESGDVLPKGFALERRGHVLFTLGDIPAADAEEQTSMRLAEEQRLPVLLWGAVLRRARRAILDGRFEECERLANEAMAAGRRAQSQFAAQMFHSQIFALHLAQGSIGQTDLETLVALTDQLGAAEPTLRIMRASSYCEMGREKEARTELDIAAADDFSDLGHNILWIGHVALLSLICSFLRDDRRASTLYEMLLPHGQLNVALGIVGAMGSASRYLGLLASTMSRWADAVRHFEDALEMNTRMGARPWLAWTQHDYAGMLLARDDRGDRENAVELLSQALETAQELGMAGLVEKALALKLRAQGIDTSDAKTSIDAVAAVVQSEHPDLRQHAAPDGTVTILFSDIEGSTEMTERLGDQRWLEVLREHNAIVRERVAACGGFEVKSEGDGFMLAFQSARKALECAVDTQRAFAERNESAGEPIRVRIGLHTGEALKEGEDFFGKHVILAARIASQAQGGEILVSSLLKELTESAGDVEFGEGREVQLKGLAGTHQVHEIQWK